ncbi:MAG: anti-sigma factor family protein [Jiangellaceae bacterium]
MSCQTTESLGPYLLGAADARERAAVEAHLAGCTECRAVADELRPVSVLLGRLDIDDLTPPEPSSDLLERMLAAQAMARGRRRVGVLVAAAALVAAVGVAGGVVGAGAPAEEVPSARTVAVTAAETADGVTATAWLTANARGTGIRLHLGGVPGGEWCSLVVRDRDGRTETAATWQVRYGEDVDVPAATTDVAIDRIDELVVMTADGEELVTFPAVEM